jgi:hypothetical protein
MRAKSKAGSYEVKLREAESRMAEQARRHEEYTQQLGRPTVCALLLRDRLYRRGMQLSGSSYSDLSESLKEEFIEEVCRLREEYKEITSVRFMSPQSLLKIASRRSEGSLSCAEPHHYLA